MKEASHCSGAPLIRSVRMIIDDRTSTDRHPAVLDNAFDLIEGHPSKVQKHRILVWVWSRRAAHSQTNSGWVCISCLHPTPLLEKNYWMVTFVIAPVLL